jgi:hypothetical protein
MFMGSNPDEGDGLSRVIKICRTTFFGGEVKPPAPCRKIFQHVQNPFKV